MPLDWDNVHFVVFDVDGTLYRQRPLRIRMTRDILLYTLLKRDLNVIAVLAEYRRIRERLGDEQVIDFERALITQTAAATANSPDRVRSIVSEWIERRPLGYLAACRHPGLSQLFAGLRRSGKSIGILSDYPAEAKLEALGLSADHIVYAGDESIGLLKPHPRGLESLIAAAGVTPHETVVIGDRVDRDGLVARRAGAHALIRSSKPIEGWQTFARFDDALFTPILASS
ncbi:HAD family hydrolase [Bradyrhizobium sp. 170]|uniref:HAD family hydrolase n=1 Tax=Bradyrhizobium sp. 170 TaxID=2782641 RepID=UPI0020003B67|nr:HAD family hydrolase [Bradyrhizobium sp. 170]UPK03224.1 HAD family hydrolase [Bradyrhizobium sp. 170]